MQEVHALATSARSTSIAEYDLGHHFFGYLDYNNLFPINLTVFPPE